MRYPRVYSRLSVESTGFASVTHALFLSHMLTEHIRMDTNCSLSLSLCVLFCLEKISVLPSSLEICDLFFVLL